MGGNPFFLIFRGPTEQTVVDLDEPGWMAKHGHIFREVGDLHLIRKEGEAVVFSVHLDEGDQGYYVGRHIKNSGVPYEAIAYGIGKKCADGHEDKLWILPWGQICVGRDVERFALQGLWSGLR